MDYSFKLVNLFYNKKLTYKIILKKSLKKRKEKKNSLIISNMNNVSSKSLSNRNNLISKSYSSNHKKPMKRHIIRSSLNNQEFSNNRMIINTSNYILNNINKNYTFKQGSSNQYRNSNDASNNIFTLKFRGINNIK